MNRNMIFMKSKLNIGFIWKIALTILMSASIVQVEAQKKHKIYLRLNYLKDTDNKKTLSVELKTRINKVFYMLDEQVVSLTAVVGDSIIDLEDFKTDKNGKAILEIDQDLGPGLITYKARFAGNDTLKSKSRSVEVKDLTMKMNLEVVDSVKTITVTTESEKNPETEEDISEGVEIEFSVQRMFSLLPLGKKSIEGGACSIEFPDDLPGDSAGNLVIFAKIVDHEEFSNVEQRAVIDWGLPVSLVTKEYNPFLASEYIKFVFMALGMVFVVVFTISKMMKKRANS